MRVEIYTKPDCPLCEEGEELLADARAGCDFELVVHNILTGYFVPVAYIEGVRARELRFTAAQLSTALEQAGDPRSSRVTPTPVHPERRRGTRVPTARARPSTRA